jgi:isopenicillin N synthase-like dioxygenase
MAAAPFDIPTVDIAPYLADPSSAAALRIVEDVRQACTTTGFFQLVGHGVPRSLQDAILQGAERLFSLPAEEKEKMSKTAEGASNRGYEVIGNQALQAGYLPDLKEVCLSF